MLTTRTFATLILALLLASSAYAQGADDGDDIMSLGIDSLMNMEIEVASKKAETLREAPGIVSVITEQDIKAMGARDLKEVLQLVPGYSYGQDVVGVISVVSRGIWAQEGRLLLLIDGVELNEVSYGTLQLGGHVPAENIARIEIIRGPGSALYGGFAELGVINVITKKGEDIDGARVKVDYGRMPDELGHANVNIALGQKIDDLEVSAHIFGGKMNESESNYTDEDGDSVNLGDSSELTNEWTNIGLNYKGAYARYLRDHYETENITLWGDIRTRSLNKNFHTDAWNFGYDGEVAEGLNAHAFYKQKVQYPWYQPDPSIEVEISNSWRRRIERRNFGLHLFYTATEEIDVAVGAERTEDESESLNRLAHGGWDDVFGHNNERQSDQSYNSYFAQASWKNPIANVTVGGRYEDPEEYDSSFVPRIGITKVMDALHFKLLYAQAYRSPVIENVSLNPTIKPEETTTYEFEVGYLIGDNMSVVANIFDTEVEDIIVYAYDAVNDVETYGNFDTVRTRGLELELKHSLAFNSASLAYSYQNMTDSDSAPFESSLDDDASIGSAQHKVTLFDTFSVTDDLSANLVVTFLSSRYSNEWNGSAFVPVELDEEIVADMNFVYRNLGVEGLDLGLGVNNIFDEEIVYPQPYEKPGDFRAGAYPGTAREIYASVSYHMPF